MKKKQTFLQKLYQDTKVKTACWTIVNCLIVIIIAGTSEISAFWVAPMIAILNMVTKEINKRYL